MNSLPFDVVKEGVETLLAGLGLKNLCRFSEYDPGTFSRSFFKNPHCFPCIFFRGQNPFDRSFLECWRFSISHLLRSSLDDSKCRLPICLFWEHTCVRDEAALGIESCHWTEFSLIEPVVHHPMERESRSMVNFSFHQQVLMCACVPTCLRKSAFTWSSEFCTFGSMPIITWISPLTTSFLEVCTRSSVRFSWRTFANKFWMPSTLPPSLVTFSVTFRISVQWTCRRKGNEVVPSLQISCSGHAWMRMLLLMNSGLLWSNGCSLLSRGRVWHFLCLFLLHYPCSEAPFCRSVLVSISCFEMGILSVLHEISLDHQLQSATIKCLVANCRLLSVDLQQFFQFCRLYNSHLVRLSGSDYWQYFIPLCVEDLSFVVLFIGHLINLWCPRWHHCRH